MRKWWRSPKQEERKPPPVPPPAESEIDLPDLAEAREALAESKKNTRRTEELGEEVKEMLAYLRDAREENHFAEGIVAMIRKGR